ncbi:hypothetical protein DUNSADRAFT_15136 [Dunaliella salina]|uniref:Encoded protein n=1 Tax=Dunaliella salina TaxID=3046 RepID=A0ABQ7H265_DUNSA|nr:hypothetical protein DUNSADRAFT_15136 [Dunaliella salina]|eukprot:KAF5840935.1 hypothetical protein DUNSADRAFT_15136 [Dunaliella salina]
MAHSPIAGMSTAAVMVQRAHARCECYPHGDGHGARPNHRHEHGSSDGAAHGNKLRALPSCRWPWCTAQSQA